MSNKTLTRRTFIQTSVAAGGGMLLGFHIPAALAARIEPTPWKTPTGGVEVNAWLTIDKDNTVTIRIPHTESPKGKRIEVRFPDAMGNPYLGFTAMLMAGLDGIENQIDPGGPVDKNLYDLPPREQKKVPEVCGSLTEALDNLSRDRAFLKKGGVMDDDFIDSYIELKMEEVMRVQLHPHPVEFDMYYSS